ncbi:MAG: isoaspartyl peptidase/L-asparaginase family protein [Bacteroidia bacterium]
MDSQKVAIILHGGAGTILRSKMDPKKEIQYRAGLQQALQIGRKLLEDGSPALDAAEATVNALENNPLYNAGKGAVYAGDGKHYLDASIMRGDNREAGSVAGITGVKNPISLARAVMERSRYVMMIGSGAEDFAKQQNLEMVSPEYFHDELRYQQWLEIKDTSITQLDHAHKGEKNWSTVGAVALDQTGNIASATSTGGMTNKQFGRVGDTPIIGSGCYANNLTCGVCCTGHGEPFMRSVVAYDLSCLIEYKGMSLKDAAQHLVQEKLVAIEGEGGLIALDAQGNYVLEFNCEGMYRAAWVSGQEEYLAIYKDE